MESLIINELNLSIPNRTSFFLTFAFNHYIFALIINDLILKAMKKILLSIVAVFFGLVLNAQESFTIGDLIYTTNEDEVSVTLSGHVYGYHPGELLIPESVSYNENTYTVTAVGDMAFQGCFGFTGSLVIPNTIVEIGESAFNHCYGFDGSLIIGKHVTTIGKDAFSVCSGFTGPLIIPASVTEIGYGAFSHCSGFTSLVIGDNVSIIGAHAFSNCDSFTGSLVIPDSVIGIGYCAFLSCGGFSQTVVLAPTPPTLGELVFVGFSCTTLIVPCGCVSAYESTNWHGADSFSTIVDDCSGPLSIWDGTVEPFDDSHAGTEDDPILIENAAQLAYMSTVINGFAYYKLMVDVDLDNRFWYPIGFLSEGVSTYFHGHFDGNDHTIYHLTTTLFWTFGSGSIKNLTIRDSEIVHQFGSNDYGGMAYSCPIIENCHIYGNVVLEENYFLPKTWRIGGIAGYCGIMKNCSYHGNIILTGSDRINLVLGGLAGGVGIMEESYNVGDFIIENEISQSCVIGGLCGKLFERISNSYNTSAISVDSDLSFIGGVVGVLDNADCAVDNCYYINTIDSQNDYGTPKSSSEMKNQDFVDLLNNGGEYYAMDILYVNQGYPVFARYYDVPENESQANISVYPNPAQDYVRIELSDNLACQSIEIYSLDGRLV